MHFFKVGYLGVFFWGGVGFLFAHPGFGPMGSESKFANDRHILEGRYGGFFLILASL